MHGHQKKITQFFNVLFCPFLFNLFTHSIKPIFQLTFPFLIVYLLSFWSSFFDKVGAPLNAFIGIHQTIQKNSVGFIPWDGITVGKDRIPWEKDRQSVLFYAPAPNFFTTLSVFIRFWCFLPFWNQETKPKTLKMNLRQSD